MTKLDQIVAKEKTVTAIAKELGVSRQIIHKRLAR
ncbi:MAG: HTH domain-containing protein, partial [Candidatus Moranbacteria bacterium]|nr:HTH domain-containing protein [Candidatus Moranbacteria bacterium]